MHMEMRLCQVNAEALPSVQRLFEDIKTAEQRVQRKASL